jgi:hypothetical protein
VIKRNTVMGIGFVLLLIGLAGLALLQTDLVPPFLKGGRGDFYRPESQGQPGLPDIKPPVPSQQGPDTRAGLERRQLPEPPDGIEKTPGPASETAEAGTQRPVVDRSGSDAETKPSPLPPIPPSPPKSLPVVMRFHFDPVQKREINVAQVHLGDSISVRVQRLGQADHGLHLAFAVPDTIETPAWRGWSAGSRRAVVAPIQDVDRISLSAEGDFGAALTRQLDSKEGAVLKLGADYPRRPGGSISTLREAAPRGDPSRRVGYEIEMIIYPGNRWNIKPRRVLR